MCQGASCSYHHAWPGLGPQDGDEFEFPRALGTGTPIPWAYHHVPHQIARAYPYPISKDIPWETHMSEIPPLRGRTLPVAHVACPGSLCGYKNPSSISCCKRMHDQDCMSPWHKGRFWSIPTGTLQLPHGIAYNFYNFILSKFYQNLWVNMGQMSCVVQHVE